ncbi:hypothetical protein [Roseibium suaedae]|uniref:DUF296 domain-containing protein n=1 Tax=Roseibium suaedae TaxID=735517 RepID=A0A1M7J3W3_9HYPH|nr:hypothetical protein [Roseibium suaedae]SHM47685.1 hypothetical protein SAMN05444272_2722 [Roseibium suaedae]
MSRSHLIQHPGPKTSPRRHVVRGLSAPLAFELPEGMTLMAAVAAAMDKAGCDTAVIRLDGLKIGPYNYVMPDKSPDDEHVAWYSQTHSGEEAVLQQATAIVGRRSGDWFLHCHAYWEDKKTGRHAGHLLPDQVTVAANFKGSGHGFVGGCFDVTADAETNFSFFRPKPLVAAPRVNAAIVCLAPHEDLVTSVAELCAELGFSNPEVLGIGSLIGADFRDAPSMASPISEVLLLKGAKGGGSGQEPLLPMFCVDPDGNFFEGDLIRGGAPVCVTFEMILIGE